MRFRIAVSKNIEVRSILLSLGGVHVSNYIVDVALRHVGGDVLHECVDRSYNPGDSPPMILYISPNFGGARPDRSATKKTPLELSVAQGLRARAC